jgi:uncharacterized membrane protein
MYLLVKLLHILSVVAFLGNVATGLFWHAHAARTRDPKLLAHTMSGIIRSDRLFTVPGVVGIIVTGFIAAEMAGFPVLRTGWIVWTLVAFSISGLLFGIRVALATAGVQSGNFDYSAYRSLALRWEIWGAVALLTPLIGLVLMVLKPGF